MYLLCYNISMDRAKEIAKKIIPISRAKYDAIYKTVEKNQKNRDDKKS